MALQKRKVVTLHAPLGKAIADELLEVIDITLKDVMDARSVWTAIITSEDGTMELVVMAEVEVPDPPRRGRRKS